MAPSSIERSAADTVGFCASAVAIESATLQRSGWSTGVSTTTIVSLPPTGRRGSFMARFSSLTARCRSRCARMTDARRSSTFETASAYCASEVSYWRRRSRSVRTSSPTFSSHSALTRRARATKTCQ